MRNCIKSLCGLNLLKNIFICLGLLCWSFLSVFADTKQNIKIQSYLNTLGYKVGKVDGIIGKNTKKQLIKALKENDIILALGPAGTGKSFLAVSVAITLLMEKKMILRLNAH